MILIFFFLDQLDEENENLIEFAIGGICNLALGNLIILRDIVYLFVKPGNQFIIHLSDILNSFHLLFL